MFSGEMPPGDEPVFRTTGIATTFVTASISSVSRTLTAKSGRSAFASSPNTGESVRLVGGLSVLASAAGRARREERESGGGEERGEEEVPAALV
jgi:hypothetical protein